MRSQEFRQARDDVPGAVLTGIVMRIVPRSESMPRAASSASSISASTAELIASGHAQRAKKAGDAAPEFILRDPDGKPVSSRDLLAKGPLVVSFYRGVWCPYCNLELQALQEALPEIAARGASLVAISPQTAPNSRKSERENKLSFPILSESRAASPTPSASASRYRSISSRSTSPSRTTCRRSTIIRPGCCRCPRAMSSAATASSPMRR